MIRRLLKRKDRVGVASRMLLGAAVVGALSLSACGIAAAVPAAEQPQPRPVTVSIERGENGIYGTKYLVEGTDLICLEESGSRERTCNWPLWNQLRGTAG